MKQIAIAVAILACIFVSPGTTWAVDQLFDAPMLYHTRPNPKDNAVGDFNNDGILDIAQGQSFTKLIMFHIGNGDGTFQSLYPFAFNNYNSADYLSVGDINNDGLDDLVCLAPNITSYVRIWLSNASSTAVPNLSDTPILVNVGSWMHQLDLADEDHDGNLDIILGGDYNGMVAVYNNGDSTFTAPTLFGVGTTLSIVSADLNHDDYPDFVNYWSAPVCYLSNGSGGYHDADTLNLVSGLYGFFALSDLTGDGELDLTYTGTDGVDYWVEVAVNLGEGVFANGVRYDLFPPGHKHLSVGRVFSDTYNDIITVNIDDYEYSVINHTGSMNFSPAVEYESDVRPGRTEAYDFNNDGFDDLLGICFGSLAVYQNHGDGTFAPTPHFFNISGSGNWGLYETTSADFSGDNYPEILVLAKWGGGGTFTEYRCRIYANDGSGEFDASYAQVQVPFGTYFRDPSHNFMVHGDFIGDGSTDLAILGTNNYRVYTGPLQSGSFLATDDFTITGKPVGIAADVDRDNDFDLLLSTVNDLMVKYNDSGAHTFDTTYDNVTAAVISGMDTLDIDHDGDLDLVAIGTNSIACYTIENDGQGNFTPLQTLTVTPTVSGVPMIDVVAADFNNDGYGDAAILWQIGQNMTTGLVEPAVFVLMNNGAGTLAHTATYHYIDRAVKMVTADFDNDGDYDLALNARFPNGAAVLINDGSGDFSQTGIDYAATGPGGPGVQLTANDFDLDGKTDIAVLQEPNALTSTLGTVAILHNTGDAAQVCPIALVGDVNLVGGVNTTDIIYLVNFVLKGGPSPLPCEANGDANCTGGVNTTDIMVLVNYVLKGGPPPCDVCALIPGTWSCP